MDIEAKAEVEEGVGKHEVAISKRKKMPSAKWEVARIGVYITIPIVATCIYAQPDCINFIVSRWKYIQYPPQAVSREEYYKKMREVAKEDK